MVLGCAFMVFLGGYSFGLFEGGWFCPLSLLLCGGGWGVCVCVCVCVCVGVEGGVGVVGASLSGGVLGAFLLRGAG